MSDASPEDEARPLTVELPKDELFAMLDIADEMVRFCSVWMPSERYYATANAIWVITHRAVGNDEIADDLKQELLAKREVWIARMREKFSEQQTSSLD